MIETRFKETEVGRIPEDWKIRKMGQYFYLKGRIGWQGLKAHEFQKQGPFLVTGTDFENGHINWSKCYHITMQRFMQDTKIQVFENDVLITKDGTIGKLAFVNNVPGLVSLNSHLLIIRPLFKDIYNLYVYYHLKGKSFSDYVDATHTGTTMASLSQEKIANYKLILPSYDEQRCIATTLMNIDVLLSELDKLIEKKKAIKQGTMQQLLTGKKRLKGFSNPWVERKLGEDATILRGGSPRPIEDYITDSQDGFNWIKIGDVKPDDKYLRKTAEKIKKEGLSRTRQVKKGDFILSNSMSFGRPYILDIDGCIHDGWLVIQDYKEAYDMQFLYYVLCSEGVKNQYISMAAGSSVQNLNKEKVANIILNAPTSLEEQSAIATVLSSMDEEISVLEAKRDKYTAIKQGMMQQLLTGNIRLI